MMVMVYQVVYICLSSLAASDRSGIVGGLPGAPGAAGPGSQPTDRRLLP